MLNYESIIKIFKKEPEQVKVPPSKVRYGECLICKKKIRHYYTKDKKYCSRDCYNIARDKRIFVKCKMCGKRIRVPGKTPRTYCSYRCRGDSMRIKPNRELCNAN